jgi:hypothetical protein
MMKSKILMLSPRTEPGQSMIEVCKRGEFHGEAMGYALQ